jgi:uncharacterized glyoxalase superfamily protein PhnB
MKHTIPHDLDHALAVRATKKALDGYCQKFAKYDATVRWHDDQRGQFSFKAKGMTVSGELAVGPRAVDLDLSVPFLLKPFQSLAVEVVDREVKAWIAKAKAGEVA